MKCDICKKMFTSEDPEEYVALFDSTKRRHYAHLMCFLEKYKN